MKTFLLIGLFSVAASAQPIYTSTDFASSATTQTMEVLATDNLLNIHQTAGANVFWDVSQAQVIDAENAIWMAADSSPYKATWCQTHDFAADCDAQFNATFTFATDASEGFSLTELGIEGAMSHFHKSPTRLEGRMVGAMLETAQGTIPVVADFDTPDVVYEFPLEFGDTYSSTSSASLDFTTFDVPMTLTGQTVRSNVVDGWGTIGLATGVTAPALRLKTEILSVYDILFNGELFESEALAVLYKWFIPGYDLPVLEFYGTLDSEGNYVLAKARRMQNLLQVTPYTSSSVGLYPNPTKGPLFVTSSEVPAKVLVRNSLGQTVSQSLDLSGLAPGLYFVDIHISGQQRTHKIIKN